MKKIIIALLIMIAVISAISAPYVINNIACERFKEKVVSEISAKENVKILDVTNACGNTSGAGNHTDLYTGVLIETKLSEIKVKSEFDGAYRVWDAKNAKFETLTTNLLDISFSDIDTDEDNNYFILEYSKASPCSMLDLRGH